MTLDLTAHLKELISTPGISGYEVPVRKIITQAWQPLCDELTISNLGSLQGLQCGEGPDPRPKVMIAAHMDAIGLMVTAIQQGLLRFTQVGGVDPRILPGQMVSVHATNDGSAAGRDIAGMVVMPPAFLLPAEAGHGSLEQKYLLVDTGLREAEVRRLVRVGDTISFAQEPLELAGGTICGHTLDNRASVAALTVCLEVLSHRKHAWDVIADATAQEEVGAIASFTDPVKINPDFAIVIDVTFANGPGGGNWRDFDLGKAVPITWGANVHPALYQAILQTAELYEIPIYKDFAPGMSGTDAYGIQVAESGIPVVELGIPLRYMHTPVEIISTRDVRRAGRLMAEFISDLPLDFMQSVKWE